MAKINYNRVPEEIRQKLGRHVGDFFDEWFREVFGPAIGERGKLDKDNIVDVENLQTSETDPLKVLRATGDGETTEFQDPPGLLAKYVLVEADSELANGRVATGGANITITEDATNEIVTWDVSPQGDGSGLDADFLDNRDSTDFVWSLSKSGDTGITEDVTLSEGAGVTLTQLGQDIEISASTASDQAEAFAFFIA